MTFFEANTSGWILRIKLTPNASFNGLRDLYVNSDGIVFLRAYVTVIAEKGKANEALIKMLAKQLKVSKQQLRIISGETGHCKKIQLISDINAETEKRINDLYKEKI